ncbi:lysylphosphatidylglycerol synthase transmembrane domain-containing protein [Solwaraspora sp. WMMA2056]|uniref:lysylphosphatidylglycerol synthase transmembrane domain-containing protein n=1 Tax=Solwaraspora sp. WMMA2056 TaxID=3015161 RepID=UPI00259BE8DF|nr:lysylphosphatidylglycerol synthase transmembrane domain-containing protein [Solwaraspora sp. WMMA2056]WJK39736.1 lysylphosphatidylglycerol synthase transmembrane domain-containing protein [Solwaraspora sp. WMMA2056]
MGRIWPWLRLVGGIAILAVLVWRLGTGAFLDGVRVIEAQTLLLAVGIGLLSTVCSAARWCLVARGMGLRLPVRTAVADYYRAIFLNAALPGGVLGDVHRAVRHGRTVSDVGGGVRAVVLERTAGQIVLFAVAAGVLLTLPVPVPAGVVTGAQLTVAVVALVAVTVGVVAVLRRRVTARSAQAESSVPAGPSRPEGQSRPAGRSTPAGWWRRALRRTATDLRGGLLARRTWPGVLLLSVVALAGHLATFLVAARAAGATAPLHLLLPLMVLAFLAMAVPLNVGGWGPREGATAWAFGAAGLGAELGLTVAVVYGLLALTASLPGAAVLTLRGLRKVPVGRLRVRLRPQPAT